VARCAGIKRDGGKCTATVELPNEYCWWHDPANAEQRKKAASKGGKAVGLREIRDLKSTLEDLYANVLGGSVDKGDAAVANQILNTRLRALELERKIKETDELEERIAGLEERYGA
jgi:hypothetical protein